MSSITRTTSPVTRLYVGFITLAALAFGAIAVPAHAAPARAAASVSAAATNDNVVTGESCMAGKTKVKVSANWDNVTNKGVGDLDYVVVNTGKKKLRKAKSYWQTSDGATGGTWVTKVNTKKVHKYRADPNRVDVTSVSVRAELSNDRHCWVALYTD